MRLLNQDQSQLCDYLAQEEFGLSSRVLMENAGNAVAEEVHQQVRDKKKKILILSGPGNNGADGFVVSRALKRKGFQNTSILIVEKPRKKNDNWDYQLERAKNSQVQVVDLPEGSIPVLLTEADVIIDAIYGTGLREKLNDRISELVKFINGRNPFVVSIDVPTGLDVNTGYPIGKKGLAVRADLTVTFGLAKPGFFIGYGAKYVGQLKIQQIGFPKECLKKASGTEFIFASAAASLILPKRDISSHKSKNGTVVVFGGSEEFPGAGILAARAASRAGAGYVWLVNFSKSYQEAIQIPEVIIRQYHQKIFEQIKKDAVLIVGPGLGVGQNTKNLILELKKRKYAKVIIDADALTTCVQENLFPLPESWLITPHAGELARIVGMSAEELEQNRLQSARLGAQKSGALCIYKGFRTIVSDGIRNMIILSGNPALSKAGCGDVLSGFIGAFYAQGLSASKAACLGTYLHGRIADEWIRSGKDVISLIPSDLNENIGELIKKIRDIK